MLADCFVSISSYSKDLTPSLNMSLISSSGLQLRFASEIRLLAQIGFHEVVYVAYKNECSFQRVLERLSRADR